MAMHWWALTWTCGSLFVLQVALQRGSSGFASSEIAGRMCECCFSSAVLRCCFPWWYLGLNLGVPFPIQLLFVLQELLWEVFCHSQREGIAKANPLLTVPPRHSYFVCSLFKIRICKTCDVGYALSPQMPFSNQTLAFRTGFVTQLCTLWSDVWIHWLWCQSAHLLQRSWDVATSVAWSSELVFLPRGVFTMTWAIGDRRGACSVVDHFFCFLVT